MNNLSKDTIFMPKNIIDFKCIGPACEDTCCSGWGISIDENTYNKYINTDDTKFNELLNNKIIKNEKNSSFYNFGAMAITKNMRCSFLNSDELCDIHGGFGEDKLCITCKYFPRVFNLVDDVYEKSLLLSCPEAARIILLHKEPIEFVEVEQEIDEENIEIRRILHTEAFYEEENPIEFFWDLRVFTIEVLQNRKFSLNKRLGILKGFYDGISTLCNESELDKIPNYIEEFKRELFDVKHIENLMFWDRDEIIVKTLLKLASNKLLVIENNKRLLQCIEDFKKGLELDNLHNSTTISSEKIIKKYNDAYENFYNPFMNEKEYILENYLVNYFFRVLGPFNKGQDPNEGFMNLINQYVLIRAYLIGIAAYHKENFHEEHIIKLIQSLSKTIEHNKEYGELFILDI